MNSGETEMIVFAFYKSPGHWWDWVVRKVTGSPYSHVEIVFRDHCIGASPRDGGVRIMERARIEPGKWDFIALNVTPQEYAAGYEFALQQVGAAYDWRAVLRRSNRDGAWMCSEFALQLLGRIDAVSSKVLLVAHTVSPGELHKMLLFRYHSVVEKATSGPALASLSSEPPR